MPGLYMSASAHAGPGVHGPRRAFRSADRTIPGGTPNPPGVPDVVAAKTVATTPPVSSTTGPPELPDRTRPRSDVMRRWTGPLP